MFVRLTNFIFLYSDNIPMAQSQGYKRFRSSIKSIHHGTSTPQTINNKIFPRASTPNPRYIDPIEQQTVPVPSSPCPKMINPHKIHRKRRHSRSSHHYRIHIDRIILIQQEKSSCAHCHCKKTKSQHILGVL
jgi:hypothetical protein